MSDDFVHTASTDSLPAALAAGKAIDPPEALRIVMESARVIVEIHRLGRLHLAVSAATVAINEGEICLLSRAETPPWDDADIDAPAFPPELEADVIERLPHDLDAARDVLAEAGLALDPRRIDVYQLGAVLLRLLGDASVDDYLRSPRVKARIPVLFRPLVDRALGFNAADCFADAEQFVQAVVECRSRLQAAAGGEGAPDTSPSVVSGEPLPDTDAGAVDAVDGRDLSEVPFERLGHFRVIERIGHGGMGDVYKAFDDSLNRPVAIKVLPAEFSRQETFVKRFYAEASAAARMVHPNVVEIHFIGQDGPHHFFAMQYVEGESLAELLGRRKRLSVEVTLQIVEQVLAGLTAAHQNGLVHRDIKPGNILLDAKAGRAYLADFGLVKSLVGSEGLTATGVVMGTVDYISPEQGRGKSVDGRSDLYSLGALMFQMLSGRLPFEAGTATAMIFQHVYETPKLLSELDPEIPSLISAIVNKLLSKSPDGRYPDAEAVLTDIRAFRAGAALPSGAEDRADESSPSIPAAVAKSIGEKDASRPFGHTQLVVLPPFEDEPLLPADLDELAPFRHWRRFRNRVADAARQRVPEFVQKLQNTQQQLDGAVAEYARRKGSLEALHREAEQALTELKQSAREWRAAADAASAKDERLRCEQLAEEVDAQIGRQQEQIDAIHLRLAKVTAQFEQIRSQRDLLNARLKAAEARLHMASGKRRLRGWQRLRRAGWKLWAAAAGAAIVLVIGGLLVHRLTSGDSAAGSSGAAVTDNSAKTAVETKPKRPQWKSPAEFEADLLKAPTSLPLMQLPGHERSVDCVTYSPDGKLLASGGGEGTIRLWDAGTGRLLDTLSNEVNGTSYSVHRLAFSPTGKLLATGSGGYGGGNGSGSLKIWDVAARRISQIIPGQIGIVDSLAFHPRGQLLAAVHHFEKKPNVHIWDAATGKEQPGIGEFDVPGAKCISFNRDGSILAIGASDGIHLWSLKNKEFVKGPLGPRELSGVMSIAFSPDGTTLSAADKQGLVVWRTDNWKAMYELIVPKPGIQDIAYRQDGKLLSIVSRAMVKVFDVRMGYVRQIAKGHKLVICAAFSPDGKSIVTGGQDPTLVLWKRNLTPLKALAAARYIRGGAVFALSRNEKQVVEAEGKSVVLRDVATGGEIHRFDGHAGNVTAVAFSHNGHWLASGCHGTGDETVRLWDLRTKQERFQIKGLKWSGGSSVNDLFFTPDDKTLLVGGGSGRTMYLVDIETGKTREPFQGLPGILCAELSPDGQFAVSGGYDSSGQEGDLRLWNVKTGQEIRRFHGHRHYVWDVAFSPDGKRLVSGGRQTIHLWDVATGKEIRRFDVDTPFVKQVAFSPDGRLIAGGDSKVWLWDVKSGDPLLQFPSGHGTIWFADNGRTLIMESMAYLRFWDLTILHD